MNYRLLARTLGIVSIVGVIANLLLFAFRVYDTLIFWIIIIVFAIIAFPVMNLIRRKAGDSMKKEVRRRRK